MVCLMKMRGGSCKRFATSHIIKWQERRGVVSSSSGKAGDRKVLEEELLYHYTVNIVVCTSNQPLGSQVSDVAGGCRKLSFPSSFLGRYQFSASLFLSGLVYF